MCDNFKLKTYCVDTDPHGRAKDSGTSSLHDVFRSSLGIHYFYKEHRHSNASVSMGPRLFGSKLGHRLDWDICSTLDTYC